MSKKVYEGQLDFLGLLNEYTDSQGATVRVREPGNSRLKPVDKSASKVKVTEAEPEQLKLDFDAASKSEPVKVEEVKVEPVKEIVKPEPVKAEEVKTPPPAEEKPASKPEKVKKAKPAPKAAEPKAPEPVKEEVKAEPVAEVPKPETTAPASSGGSKEILFKQCKKCWCFDCKHNSRNEGVPRDICGTSMPCPACESCISEDQATICEIGNAKEGCKLRAQEEGILIEEEPV